MDKPKLCLVIPSLQTGGMERVMTELAYYFCDLKSKEVHLVLYGIKPEIFYNVPTDLIIHKPSLTFNNNFRFIHTLIRLFYLRHTIKSIKPDAILSFGELWNSFVLIATTGLSYPVFISDRCQPGKKIGKFHSHLRKIFYPRANGIIAQTNKAKEIYSAELRHKNIEVIGNPIQLNRDFADESKKGNIVLTVGRLIQSKNQDKLIELFVQINMPEWKLIIVGDNALNQNGKEKLQQLIIELKASNKVILAGNQSEISSYYMKSKIFAFTSDSEGFPNVIGEAQSYGLPVIAFDCVAGPSDLITDNLDGYLVPLHDYTLFREKLKFLMNNEAIREKFGKKAKENIKRFSIETIGPKFNSFIFGEYETAAD